MTPLAVYVHVPFCVVKCGYCDFNTYAGLDHLKPAYGEALLRELDWWAGLLRRSRVTSISFGGGTPGEFPVAALVAVIAKVVDLAGEMAPGAEISIEANPGSTSAEALRALAAGGVNRVSFGAQSFAAAELQFLDRTHSPEATLASLANARAAGIASVGLDLIYGLPGQTLDAWRANVERAVVTGADHLSCYALTVEEGTPLARRVSRGDVAEADPDTAATMYEAAEDLLETAGFVHYEISNWAKAGHESRHNAVYWAGGDYLGVGAGAHGFIAGERYENTAHPAAYARKLARGAAGDATTPVMEHTYVPEGAGALVDVVEARLRLLRGFDAGELRRFDLELAAPALAMLDGFREFGLLEAAPSLGPNGLRLAARGRLLHGEICARLLAALT